jgi:UDP-N-acetyl-D-mannosaminuronic acid dehydrogenase
MAEICVIGLGYVGLPTASLLATAGFQVLGVDVDADVVEGLRSGKTRLEEAGLATLVSAACRSGNLTAATKPEPSDTFIICVPTPVTADHRVELKMVEAAANSIKSVVKKGNLVILESTSPMGTTRGTVGGVLKKAGFELGQDVHLCYCPERVLPGNTVAELVNNDRIIGGFTPACAEHAQEIYTRFCQGKISLTDDLTAEMCKLMENTYRDVNIAVANVFARVAEDAGVNVWEAIDLSNLHPRVKILKPGPGVGGHCIPVDPWFFVEAFPQHTALLRASRDTNDGQAVRMLTRMLETGLLKSGDKLAILGAAYKADIDDARESPAALLAHAAVKAKIKVAVHDPLVRAGDHHGLVVSNNLEECLTGAAAAALLTEHKYYRSLSSKVFAQHMSGKLICDSRNWLNRKALSLAGFKVLLLGDGAKDK